MKSNKKKKPKYRHEELLNYSAALFCNKGYYETSMRDISRAAGIMKSSVYHHFIAKEVIMREVIKRIDKYCKNELFPLAKMNPVQFMSEVEKYLAQKPENNLIWLFGVEIASINEGFDKIIQDHYSAWIETIKTIISEHGAGLAAIKADYSVAVMQGLITFSRIYKDNRYLSFMCSHLLDFWELKTREYASK